MYKIWKKQSQEEIKTRVFNALEEDVNYKNQFVLGIPASYLDEKVFSQDEAFLKDAPFISTLVQNPNHIGCHTLGKSMSYFKGTQTIEKELIEICAVDIFRGNPHEQDGYVASGGTEANMQAIWTYRNYYKRQKGAAHHEIAVLCSQDTHYSIDKAADVLNLDTYKIPVDEHSREFSPDDVHGTALRAIADGKKFFIVICNMMTTIFGSVDDPDAYAQIMRELDCPFFIHVDGAFGGFYYPFAAGDISPFTFKNPNITSFTLDAHKMAQAPYGTGIFLIRKGFMQYAVTKSASYILGEDCTLIGSRSGANAVATWMILVKNGPYGWHEKIFILQKRTDWMCSQLEQLGVSFYRHPHSNNITIKATCLDSATANEFGMMPDDHDDPKWYKIVVMDHVTIDKLEPLIAVLKERSKTGWTA